MRTDCLPDLSEQLVFFGSALRLVHHDIIFQRQCNLQRQPNQQTQVRRAEHPPFRVRKQKDPEVVFPRLQAYCHQVGDSLCQQRLLAGLEFPSRKRW